jgi:phosphatidylserine decarboxylase
MLNRLSRWVGWWVHRTLPQPFRTLSVRWFQRRYRIDMSEAEFELSAYPTIGDLFTRRLKPGLRPVGRAPVHPVDGRLTSVQRVVKGQLLQVKGRTYSFEECFRKDVALYENGVVLTYYLCPTDYHRVHSPVAGDIQESLGVGGDLWPVNELSVKRVPRLFARNERVILDMVTPHGPLLYVMVGATNVGHMSLAFDAEFRSNRRDNAQERRRAYHPSVTVQPGQELGTFHMGSTVLVAFSNRWTVDVEGLQAHCGPVKMGQSMADFFKV